MAVVVDSAAVAVVVDSVAVAVAVVAVAVVAEALAGSKLSALQLPPTLRAPGMVLVTETTHRLEDI